MSLPDVVSREEWEAARKELLAEEKAFTKQRDALNTKRRRLPMVKIEKDYEFEGPDGNVRLPDLFEGRRQLVVGHFMFDPSWDDGCPSCTAGADEISDGLLEHLHTRDTTFAYVSRAPLAKIQDYKSRQGWTFPWYSSYGSDFNYDFHVTMDESVMPDRIQLPHQGRVRAARAGRWTPRSHRSSPAAARSCVTATPCTTRTPSTRGARDDWWVVLPARRDRARPPGGLGGAEGARRLRPRQRAQLQVLIPRVRRRAVGLPSERAEGRRHGDRAARDSECVDRDAA